MSPDDQMPRPTLAQQKLIDAGYSPVTLPPAEPEHIHDLCQQAAKNADRLGPHGTQPATVAPSRGDHSVLLGCVVIVVFLVPWLIGCLRISAWFGSGL